MFQGGERALQARCGRFDSDWVQSPFTDARELLWEGGRFHTAVVVGSNPTSSIRLRPPSGRRRSSKPPVGGSTPPGRVIGPWGQAVLLLNIDYTPLEVISWRDAITKIIAGKVELVERYVDRFIRSPSVTFPFPAVVRITSRYVRRRVRLSRGNILCRDAYTCQYCGVRPRRSSGAPRLEDLTIDHVVPRAQARKGWVTLPWNGTRARVTSWENVLTACGPCNARKADRTPGEARMTMRRRPRTPSSLDIAWMSLLRYEIPDEWQGYLPQDSHWRDYWSAELDST